MFVYVSPNSSLKNGPWMPGGSVLRMSATFLRTWYQVSGTCAAGAESLIAKNTSDSPGFE